jgi:hypothetical protein
MNEPKTKEEIAEIITAHWKWLHGEDGGAKANLSGANLRGVDLYGTKLRGADLRGADLRGADLRGVDLRGANLYEADLRGADLYGANLHGANLYEADLRGANIRGADLYGTNLDETDLRGTSLYEADLRGVKKFKTELTDCPMTIEPIGSDNGKLEAWPTKKGIIIRRGCFNGTIPEFLGAVTNKHENNDHAEAYRFAIEMFVKSFKARGINTESEE